ncbi:hypothetical protein PanWU01x14_188540 [Parasponia andersonii]|uniref:Uncharacterized protein n=1 Tax=Parasponia andersonii TaxID=3476 RepID=A0A2P5C2R8_PARAD|nr:hypothetical protein PanWU01x14_188540 [Parasponia andersonii]
MEVTHMCAPHGRFHGRRSMHAVVRARNRGIAHAHRRNCAQQRARDIRGLRRVLGHGCETAGRLGGHSDMVLRIAECHGSSLGKWPRKVGRGAIDVATTSQRGWLGAHDRVSWELGRVVRRM